MATTPLDDEREHRISMEIIVDAYSIEEERMGWYYYLDNNLSVPFQAIWDGETVKVVGMSDEEECQTEMRVNICYEEKDNLDVFSVSLSNLQPIDADETTTEAIADWKYWVERGHEFREDEEEEDFY